jgi:hypothetical protein
MLWFACVCFSLFIVASSSTRKKEYQRSSLLFLHTLQSTPPLEYIHNKRENRRVRQRRWWPSDRHAWRIFCNARSLCIYVWVRVSVTQRAPQRTRKERGRNKERTERGQENESKREEGSSGVDGCRGIVELCCILEQQATAADTKASRGNPTPPPPHPVPTLVAGEGKQQQKPFAVVATQLSRGSQSVLGAWFHTKKEPFSLYSAPFPPPSTAHHGSQTYAALHACLRAAISCVCLRVFVFFLISSVLMGLFAFQRHNKRSSRCHTPTHPQTPVEPTSCVAPVVFISFFF